MTGALQTKQASIFFGHTFQIMSMMLPLNANPVYMQGTNLGTTVLADALAPKGPKPSAGTRFFSKFL